MYDSLFCRVYNEFGWNEYPRAFGLELLDWLDAEHIGVKTALDLGCGTGVLCETLSERGIMTHGIDLSESMIAVARERRPDLSYAVGDMTAFTVPRPFDLATCTGDALNHVTDLGAVKGVFSCVRRALAPGGLFVFDLLKPDEIPEGEPFEADFVEGLTVRFSARREPDDFTTLRVEGLRTGIPAFTEVIREKLYDVDVICSLLRETGFGIRQCADHLLKDTHSTTWYIVAQRT